MTNVHDAVCRSADRARGIEEIVLALMEDPNSFDKALSVLHDAADVLAGDLEDAGAELMRLSVKRASQPLCGYPGGVASAAPFSFPATPVRQLNGRKERS